MPKGLGIYLKQCPNCGGPISDDRLNKGLACEKCLPGIYSELKPEDLFKALEEAGTIKNLREKLLVEKETDEFKSIFERALGFPPWSSQLAWARRVFEKRSFSIIAPTGIGKTAFGLLLALYFAMKGKKSYLVFPTTPLVIQMCEKLSAFNNKINAVDSDRILCLHGSLKQSEKKAALERLNNGSFSILITTSKFMISRSENLSSYNFDLIFIDDVDSVLRSKKSIDSTLHVVGFSSEEIEIAMEAIKLKRKIASGHGNDEDEKRLNEILNKLDGAKKRIKSNLIVSSATGRARGSRALLFRELLGFQIGGRTELFRNVDDFYEIVDKSNLEEKVAELVMRLGKGGLIFVPSDMGVSYAEDLVNRLREKGIKAESFHSKSHRILSAFQRGELDVLVGVATYYGVMVRGLDLPAVIRYAVFTSPPRFKFSLDLKEAHPFNALRLLSIISESEIPAISYKAKKILVPLRKIIRRLSPSALQMLSSDSKLSAELESIRKQLNQAKDFLREAFKDERVLRALRESGEIFIEKHRDITYLIMPDAKTYIQATGRTSRLYAGGLTKGLAITLIDSSELPLLLSLQRILSFYIDNFEFLQLREEKLQRTIEEVDRDRKKLIDTLEGREAPRIRELVKTAIMIVESPNKARTIASFFGKPSIRILPSGGRIYEVSIGNISLSITSTEGHILDLVPRAESDVAEYAKLKKELYGVLYDDSRKIFIPVYSTIKKCRKCGHQFVEELTSCPICNNTNIFDKDETIRALRDIVTEYDKVLIATDPDAEGEKIGWDVAALLRPLSREIRRIEFHEVTRKAILEALKNERLIDEKLVKAQIVRRIEDRWIGFSLSRKLQTDFWIELCRKKGMSNCRENRNLSAGRVQTPVLGWIVERYNNYLKSTSLVCSVDVNISGKMRTFEFLVKDRLEKGEGEKLQVRIVNEEKVKLSPPPPFTTDTLISEANRILRFSSSEVMKLAQDLFELGLITYHRTDSTRVSSSGIEIAREYLKRVKGEKWKDSFVPRTWGEGGAHEAIRPTKPFSREELVRLIEEGEIEFVKLPTNRHLLLYDLIFKRFIASQMKHAEVIRQRVEIQFNKIREEREILTNKIIEHGFLEMYQTLKLETPFAEGEFEVSSIKYYRKKLLPLYTQGEVVAMMKERGIGRPSTYATIISKLQERRYVMESKKHGKLIPTELGINIFNYLIEKFKEMVSEERTRALENKMDKISEGRINYLDVIAELYEEIKRVEGMEE
ncbi:MAG: reverse gyrase [Fervidicoccaceae archaeon]